MLFKMKLILLVFAVIVVQNAVCDKFPSYLKLCRKSDPKFFDCLRDAVQDSLVKIKDGIPSLGIGPMDPLKIDHMSIQDGGGAINIKQDYRDILVEGILNNAEIKWFKKHENNSMTAEMFISSQTFHGDYEMSGRILLLPVQGKGQCNITLYNVQVNQKIVAEPFMKKGKEYWKIKEYSFDFEPGNVELKYTNLFNGDKVLESAMETLIRENWKPLFNEMKPRWEYAFGIIFRDIANKIFSNIPINEVFLD